MSQELCFERAITVIQIKTFDMINPISPHGIIYLPARTPLTNHRHSTLCVVLVWSVCGLEATIGIERLIKKRFTSVIKKPFMGDGQ